MVLAPLALVQDTANMAKLLDDPKVADLVAKESAKAVKAARREVITAFTDRLKTEAESAKAAGNKGAATMMTTVVRDVKASLKADA